MTIHSQTRAITYSGQYWAFAHFSRHIKRRARRFESAGRQADVHHVGFENPDGGKVLVVTNSGPARSAILKQADKIADLALPANSITTLAWS